MPVGKNKFLKINMPENQWAIFKISPQNIGPKRVRKFYCSYEKNFDPARQPGGLVIHAVDAFALLGNTDWRDVPNALRKIILGKGDNHILNNMELATKLSVLTPRSDDSKENRGSLLDLFIIPIDLEGRDALAEALEKASLTSSLKGKVHLANGEKAPWHPNCFCGDQTCEAADNCKRYLLTFTYVNRMPPADLTMAEHLIRQDTGRVHRPNFIFMKSPKVLIITVSKPQDALEIATYLKKTPGNPTLVMSKPGDKDRLTCTTCTGKCKGVCVTPITPKAPFAAKPKMCTSPLILAARMAALTRPAGTPTMV